ncbi:NACHT domain-containing protein [Streptomyces justiciae]|uniref:NACHT domain-containing protein n=1 Tax=Streptomyces justiciae TaxID=2780140 RepID=UPI002117CE4B|nr:NACHT domain-containing protein [Streptomyces justiciae]MCW8379454.1 NACHT domain-containing protein [Streptomyces justiciae]
MGGAGTPGELPPLQRRLQETGEIRLRQSLAAALQNAQHQGVPPEEIRTHFDGDRRLRPLAELLEAEEQEEPAPGVPRPAQLDSVFEEAYLRRLGASLEEIPLYGFTGRRVERAGLAMAYTHLRVSLTGEGEGDRGAVALPVDAVLADTPRLFVRGEAGSGKSTLLRRLAHSAAQDRFEGHLVALRGVTPVLVELREYADGRLPTWDGLPRTGAGIDAPEGWLERRAAQGRVLLLLDGLDELVPEAQERVHVWLLDRLAAYPGNRVVVTARPTTSVDQRLTDRGFRQALLEPMNPEELARFVGNWYRAHPVGPSDAASAPGGARPGDAAEGFAQEVFAALKARPALAELVGTPLYASLICALWQEHRRLPDHPTEAFRQAVRLMVDRGRDQQVPRARSWFAASDTDVLSMLYGLAWRLSRSGLSEMARAPLLRHVREELGEHRRDLGVTAEEVVDHLIARSGILRVSPLSDAVGFVHRSFQEYLTAEAALKNIGEMRFLIDRAHLDVWRDTVLMAAYLAAPAQHGTLVKGLADRARDELHHERLLWRLAISCLDTRRAPPKELLELLHPAADSVLPPRRRAESRALAAVPDWTLRALPRDLDQLTGEAAGLTVFTATLTGDGGGEQALTLLSGYARQCASAVRAAAGEHPTKAGGKAAGEHPTKAGGKAAGEHPTKAAGKAAGREANRLRAAYRELVGGWQYFDPDRYAERVLSLLPLDVSDGRGAMDLPIARPGEWTAAATRLADRVAGLALAVPCDPEVLGGLRRFTGLRRLRVDALPEDSDLTPLGTCRTLRELALQGEGQLPDLTPLGELTELRRLVLWRWLPFSLRNVPLPESLLVLGMMGLREGEDLAWLAPRHSGLQELSLAGAGRPCWTNALATLTHLRELDLGGYDLTAHLPAVLRAAPGVHSLGLHSCTVPPDLAGLDRLTRLALLDLRDVTGPEGTPLDLSGVARPAGARKVKVVVSGGTRLDETTVPPWVSVRHGRAGGA